MSTAQDMLSASDAEPAAADSVSDDASGPGADHKGCGEFGMDDGADLGGHTLLSRPPTPQGRRSLFRR